MVKAEYIKDFATAIDEKKVNTEQAKSIVYSTLQHIVNKHLKKHQAFNKSNHM
jgi:hypothetical protein